MKDWGQESEEWREWETRETERSRVMGARRRRWWRGRWRRPKMINNDGGGWGLTDQWGVGGVGVCGGGRSPVKGTRCSIQRRQSILQQSFVRRILLTPTKQYNHHHHQLLSLSLSLSALIRLLLLISLLVFLLYSSVTTTLPLHPWSIILKWVLPVNNLKEENKNIIN